MLFVAFMVRPRIYSLIPSIQSEFRKGDYEIRYASTSAKHILWVRFTHMNRKRHLFIVIAICVFATIGILVGCRLSPGNGTIYYEAKSSEAVTALRSRIEPLRAALRGNTNFTEITGRKTLMFEGTANGAFADCWIGFDEDENDAAKDHQAVLVVSTTRTFSSSQQVGDLRKVVEQSLGPEVVKLLTINFDEKLIDVR